MKFFVGSVMAKKGLREKHSVLAGGLSAAMICSGLGLTAYSSTTGPLPRRISCNTPANATSCYHTRGRLALYNGTPAFRLWKIGTPRLLGIYSGPSVSRNGLDNETPEFPRNVQQRFEPLNNVLYADFEVCPLEVEKPDAMQAVCIESATHLVVKSLADAKDPAR
jgi:hypothetical protein